MANRTLSQRNRCRISCASVARHLHLGRGHPCLVPVEDGDEAGGGVARGEQIAPVEVAVQRVPPLGARGETGQPAVQLRIAQPGIGVVAAAVQPGLQAAGPRPGRQPGAGQRPVQPGEQPGRRTPALLRRPHPVDMGPQRHRPPLDPGHRRPVGPARQRQWCDRLGAAAGPCRPRDFVAPRGLGEVLVAGADAHHRLTDAPGGGLLTPVEPCGRTADPAHPARRRRQRNLREHHAFLPRFPSVPHDSTPCNSPRFLWSPLAPPAIPSTDGAHPANAPATARHPARGHPLRPTAEPTRGSRAERTPALPRLTPRRGTGGRRARWCSVSAVWRGCRGARPAPREACCPPAAPRAAGRRRARHAGR